ncbi:MAG: DNA mismatch repair endonuclease MutL [Bdellovibrionales bacterium]|nr:DNA mismatch repair endonuclease MutL [Bdellovibrionales bacterium]
MSIRVLAPDVVDKIAAGEVLERPANLLKELVENSLDAGATEIEVEFSGGGRDVCVRDNGGGMALADLKVALLRHATSKISESEDLFRLGTFGFRGEALASIAAVSKLSLVSRRGEKAYRIESDFGQLSEPAEVAGRPGTEVRVNELFANVPARLRFLKSEAAEHTQIKTTLKALALAHENVGFRVISKGELLFHWPKGQTFKERALDVLGTSALFEGEMNIDGINAQVLVSSPQDTLNVNRSLWFFAQGRWVQDRSLTAAVMEAYRNLLMHGEYPTAVVRLTLAPEEVDVNVHPTKAQVKFRDSQGAFRVTCRAIRSVLEQAPWLGSNAPLASSKAETTFALSEPQPSTLSFRAPEFERTQFSKKSFPLAQVRESLAGLQDPSMVVDPLNGKPAMMPTSASVSVPDQPHSVQEFRWGDLQVIGQMHQTYIVAQNGDAMYLVDQHAAHERVMFERLMSTFKAGRMDVQTLLLPLVIDLSAEEVEALHGNRAAIEKMGLSVERMGPESLAVQAIPSLVNEGAISEALQRLAFELVQTSNASAVERVVGDIFASMACHSVIRAGQSQSVEQMQSLLAQMDEFPLSSFCPHGRPVFIKRRFSEIEREFGRLV